MFEYKTVRGWTSAGTMNAVDKLKEDGWELVSTHPRFVFLMPFFPLIGEMFGLLALVRRDVAKQPEEWSPNPTPDSIRQPADGSPKPSM